MEGFVCAAILLGAKELTSSIGQRTAGMEISAPQQDPAELLASVELCLSMENKWLVLNECFTDVIFFKRI